LVQLIVTTPLDDAPVGAFSDKAETKGTRATRALCDVKVHVSLVVLARKSDYKFDYNAPEFAEHV
jgi:hypothetical protein